MLRQSESRLENDAGLSKEIVFKNTLFLSLKCLLHRKMQLQVHLPFITEKSLGGALQIRHSSVKHGS